MFLYEGTMVQQTNGQDILILVDAYDQWVENFAI